VIDLPSRLLEAVAGEPLAVRVPVLDATGAEVPLTSEWSARAQVRGHWSADRVLHAWATGDGSGAMSLDLVNNGVVLTATAEQTATWQAWPSPTVWDLFVVDPDGVPRKLIKSSSPVHIEPAVTRIL
jgi:hypothetical protein